MQKNFYRIQTFLFLEMITLTDNIRMETHTILIIHNAFNISVSITMFTVQTSFKFR